MVIYVSGKFSHGNTELSAFDLALLDMGVANYNIIRLSSVIPPDSKVVETEFMPRIHGGIWGDRLYAVYADARTSKVGESVYAGVGWVLDEEGKGLFVEHEGHSEEEVSKLIDDSLNDLMTNRGMAKLDIRKKIVGGKCTDQPVCALVVSIYEREQW